MWMDGELQGNFTKNIDVLHMGISSHGLFGVYYIRIYAAKAFSLMDSYISVYLE